MPPSRTPGEKTSPVNITATRAETDAAKVRAHDARMNLSAWTRSLWESPILSAAEASAVLTELRGYLSREVGRDVDPMSSAGQNEPLRRGLAILGLLATGGR